jgi:hypothetical protein
MSEHKWMIAIAEADKKNDLAPLVALFDERAPINDMAQALLADFLRNRKLQTVARIKDTDINLAVAAEDFRERRGERRFSRDDPEKDRLLAVVAKEHGVTVEALAEFVRQGGSVFRRVKALIPSDRPDGEA